MISLYEITIEQDKLFFEFMIDKTSELVYQIYLDLQKLTDNFMYVDDLSDDLVYELRSNLDSLDMRIFFEKYPKSQTVKIYQYIKWMLER